MLNIVANKNNTLYYGVANSVIIKLITFDTGYYNLEDINMHIQDELGVESIIKQKLNQGSGKNVFELVPGHNVYFKDKPKTFGGMLGFDTVNLLQLSTLRASIVDLIKDLVNLVSADCFEGSC